MKPISSSRYLLLMLVGCVAPLACNALAGMDRFSVDPNWVEGGDAGASSSSSSSASSSGGASECSTDLTCPGQSNDCQTRSCVAGACKLVNEPAGTIIQGQPLADCMRIECDGEGNTRMVIDPGDIPNDGVDCTEDQCGNDGMPLHVQKPSGAACTQNGGKFCNDTGQCVECAFKTDCPGDGPCVNGKCVPPECNDGIKNGDESDIDCGGAQCALCGTDQGCVSKSDCESNVCIAGTCRAPTCIDATKNAQETDIDRGGPTCSDCVDGQKCLVAADCVSGVCSGGTCQVPTCKDGVKNGNETDLDCGGGCIPGCAAGKVCQTNLDCATEVCRNGVCTAIAQIEAGTAQTCALLGDGTVFCWGANGAGQLGDGTLTSRLTAGIVPNLAGVTQIALAVQVQTITLAGHVCARTNQGKLFCWGRNTNGQVGDGTVVDVLTPKEIISSGVAQVATGRAHTCARLDSGAVQCWGLNSNGQLGTGTMTNLSAPSSPILNVTAKHISAGHSHTCAVLVTGELSCWGANASGQLGNGTTVGSSTPLVVPGLANMAIADLGFAFSCAIDEGGSVRCFGDNINGQLALGDTMARSTPTLVPNVVGIVGVATGANIDPAGGHTCFLNGAGVLGCAGLNTSGQLGLGDTAQRLTPAAVSLPAVAQVSAGLRFTCARLVGGPIRCWGRNDLGQLGNGLTAAVTSTPVPVVFP